MFEELSVTLFLICIAVFGIAVAVGALAIAGAIVISRKGRRR
jgi:hypothetical protein